jgi:holo-[acyl-carrier protein] synthase
LIIGIGTDIIEIDRIQKAMDRSTSFIEKIFTKSEIEYLKSRNMRAEFAAGKFAAKEAVAKAIGTGFRGFDFRDIEIDKTTLGKPIVILRGNAKKMDKKWGKYKIHLSISHSKENAVAYAVIETIESVSYNTQESERDI